jgi:hypothetical protein
VAVSSLAAIKVLPVLQSIDGFAIDGFPLGNAERTLQSSQESAQ